jgi:hypothetical protein
MLGAHHPQIFTFIDYIRKEQGITDVQKSRLAAGIQRPVSSKSTYVRSGRRIQSIIQQYTLKNIQERQFLNISGPVAHLKNRTTYLISQETI